MRQNVMCLRTWDAGVGPPCWSCDRQQGRSHYESNTKKGVGMATVKIKILEPAATHNHLPALTAALNRRFEDTKRKNPLGFLEQFEEQLETHFIEATQELGGRYVGLAEGEHVFSFTSGVSRVGHQAVA